MYLDISEIRYSSCIILVILMTIIHFIIPCNVNALELLHNYGDKSAIGRRW